MIDAADLNPANCDLPIKPQRPKLDKFADGEARKVIANDRVKLLIRFGCFDVLKLGSDRACTGFNYQCAPVNSLYNPARKTGLAYSE